MKPSVESSHKLLVKRGRRLERFVAERGGPTPLDVMLGNMWWWNGSAEKAAVQLMQVLADKGASPEQLLEAWKSHCAARVNAQHCAMAAAPYVHPRLAAVKVKVDPTDDLTQLNDGELIDALSSFSEDELVLNAEEFATVNTNAANG